MLSKIYFDFDQIDEKTRKKLVQGSIIPRPIAWVTSRNDDGSINLAPFSYFNMIANNVVGISFQNTNQHYKHSYENIKRSKEAIIHISDLSLLSAMDDSAKVLAKNESELELINLPIEKAKKVDVPILKDVKIALEVNYLDEVVIKDDENPENQANLLILKVIAIHVDASVLDIKNNYIIADKLDPVARLGGPNYASIKTLNYQRKY